VQPRSGGHHKWHQKVKGEKPGEGGIIDSEPTSKSRYQGPPKIRESGKQIGDHCGSPKAHLTPRQHITEKGGRYDQQ